MDALSLIANVIAVIGATKSAAKGLRKLCGLSHAPRQLAQLLDELHDFTTLLASVERITSGSHQPHDPTFNDHLRGLTLRAAAQISRVNRLADTGWISDINMLDDKSIKSHWKHWLRVSDIGQISADLRSIRQDVAASLTVMTACEVPQVRSTLREIVMGNERANENLQRTLDRLEGISGQLAGIIPRMNQLEEDFPRLGHPHHSTSHNRVENRSEHRADPSCGGFCSCQCHRSTYVSPKWAKSLIGIIMLSWSGVLGQPICSDKKCQRSQIKMLKIFWYFPAWFLGRLVLFQHQFTATDGYAVFVRTPRVISRDYTGFSIAKAGDVAIMQVMFQEEKASPFDVDGEGFSYLAFAVSEQRIDMCRFLLQQSADPEMESVTSQSPLTLIWSRILSRPDNEVMQALKTIFSAYMDPTEDLHRFLFTSIHKIVLGLTRVDLHDFLLLSSAEIDVQCSAGKSPLMWAVIKGNKQAVGTLLEFGARLDITDKVGRSVFTYAILYASNEDTDVLCTLICAARRRALESSPFSKHDAVGMAMRGHTSSTSNASRASLKFLIEFSDGNEPNPVAAAADRGNYKHALILFDAGASIDRVAHNPGHFHPILLAVQKNHHSILRLLLSRGAKTNVKIGQNETIIHTAAAFADLETMEILKGAQLCCINFDGRDELGFDALEVFDNERPTFVTEDDATRLRCREAFVQLLRNPPGSDHVCTPSGPRPDLDFEIQVSRRIVEISDEEDESEEFFETRSRIGVDEDLI